MQEELNAKEASLAREDVGARTAPMWYDWTTIGTVWYIVPIPALDLCDKGESRREKRLLLFPFHQDKIPKVLGNEQVRRAPFA